MVSLYQCVLFKVEMYYFLKINFVICRTALIYCGCMHSYDIEYVVVSIPEYIYPFYIYLNLNLDDESGKKKWLVSL